MLLYKDSKKEEATMNIYISQNDREDQQVAKFNQPLICKLPYQACKKDDKKKLNQNMQICKYPTLSLSSE